MFVLIFHTAVSCQQPCIWRAEKPSIKTSFAYKDTKIMYKTDILQIILEAWKAQRPTAKSHYPGITCRVTGHKQAVYDAKTDRLQCKTRRFTMQKQADGRWKQHTRIQHFHDAPLFFDSDGRPMPSNDSAL